MLHTTRWKPNTCDCIIFFSWDDAQSDETRVLTATDECIPCSLHTEAANPAALFEVVKAHNTNNQSGQG